ncbi:MAG: hypothetical protein QOE64_797 [Frankiales bacterium]|nr:hypothetical protein [Frankiales bacterium]
MTTTVPTLAPRSARTHRGAAVDVVLVVRGGHADRVRCERWQRALDAAPFTARLLVVRARSADAPRVLLEVLRRTPAAVVLLAESVEPQELERLVTPVLDGRVDAVWGAPVDGAARAGLALAVDAVAVDRLDARSAVALEESHLTVLELPVRRRQGRRRTGRRLFLAALVTGAATAGSAAPALAAVSPPAAALPHPPGQSTPGRVAPPLRLLAVIPPAPETALTVRVVGTVTTGMA